LKQFPENITGITLSIIGSINGVYKEFAYVRTV
jgi:hypothetical protein